MAVVCRNHKGETVVHCAAYNSGDSGSLMEHLMEVCEKNGTFDTHDILSLHEKEARVGHSASVLIYGGAPLLETPCTNFSLHTFSRKSDLSPRLIGQDGQLLYNHGAPLLGTPESRKPL